jgi:hypothetical protein
MPELDELKRRFPLWDCWGDATLFAETVSVAGVEIHLSGFSAESQDGDAITGSAAELDTAPMNRAYFELLERASIVAAERSKAQEWSVRDARGVAHGCIESSALVPENPEPDRWRYARSNGVALGPSWSDACRSALWELIERDRILRSWYGDFAPGRIVLPPGLIPNRLDELYAFEAYSFGISRCSTAEVVAVFGFPRVDSNPLLYGFGARGRQSDALAVAAKESIQRLGFLWGEPIPSEDPEFSPGPHFHQELFLRPSSHAQLHQWLAGEQDALKPSWRQPCRQASPRLFADITPPALASKLFVAKALPQTELPLVFGIGHPQIESKLPDYLKVHPIA